MHRIDTNSAMSTVAVNETHRISSLQPLTMWKKVFNHQKCSSTWISTCWTNIHKLNQWPPKIGQNMLFINQIPKTTQTWPQGRQNHLTDAHIYVTRLPRRHKVTQLNIRWVPRGSQEDVQDAKSPQSDPTEARMGAMWLPKALPRDPKRHPKWARARKRRPHGKTYVKLHYSHEEIAFFSPKNSKTLAFCPPAEGHFWCFFWKSTKTLVFSTLLPSKIGPKNPNKFSRSRMHLAPVSPPNPSFLKLTFVPPGDWINSSPAGAQAP